MRTALWLVLRDLGARPYRAALAALLVASLTAVALTLELLGRAREESVAAAIDGIGPNLSVGPAGATAAGLDRLDLALLSLPPATEASIETRLGPDLRRLERRVVARVELHGVTTPLIGLEELPDGLAEPGASLAARLEASARVTVGGLELDVARSRPSEASMEDHALFVSLGTATRLSGVAGPNWLRVYLGPGASIAEAAHRLEDVPGIAVIRNDRGAVADGETQDALSRHRALVQVVLLLTGLVGLAVVAHLDALERLLELATLKAIGASRTAIVAMVTSRSAAVAGAGAILGAAISMLTCWVQAPEASFAITWSGALVPGLVLATTLLGAASAAPTGFVSASRDPIRYLQDT